MATHSFRVADARRIKHPIHPKIEKHIFLVRAKDLPIGVSDDPNAREAKGLNRRVYRDIKKNLLGQESYIDIFDLMNKGITILAEKVVRKDDRNYDVIVDRNQGIVDGGHTYKIITDAIANNEVPDNQYVEVQIRIGVPDDMITEIARGLNTGMQVKPHSLANLDGKYDWIKDEISEKPFADNISWREDDDGDYDVRDLICVMEALNVHDFPNDGTKHPIQSYEKWSGPATKFSEDFDLHKDDFTKSKYYSFQPILIEALELFDIVRHGFRDVYNKETQGRAASLDIVEEARGNRNFEFPFAGIPASKYRLTKGALYPIFAAFRNKVRINQSTKLLEWDGGFESVLQLWYEAASVLCIDTKHALKDIGHKPDMIGKNRGHWAKLHQTLEVQILRDRLRQKASDV